MGGHALLRTDSTYRAAVELGARLTEAGRTVLTGGGPGAMEAANLGAYLSPWPDTLDEALTILQAAPAYGPSIDAWVRAAVDIRRRWPPGDAGRSLSIPTWFYGHEPTNAFATGIAKYFANALREDTLLHRCRGGIVYLPGQAGTVQEIFQAVTENFYAADPALVAPMILVGTDYWTRDLPRLAAVATAGRKPPAGRRHPLRRRRRVGCRSAPSGRPRRPDRHGTSPCRPKLDRYPATPAHRLCQLPARFDPGPCQPDLRSWSHSHQHRRRTTWQQARRPWSPWPRACSPWPPGSGLPASRRPIRPPPLPRRPPGLRRPAKADRPGLGHGGPGRGAHGRFDGDLTAKLAEKLGVTEDKVTTALKEIRDANKPDPDTLPDPGTKPDPAARDAELAKALAGQLGIDEAKIKTALDEIRSRAHGPARHRPEGQAGIRGKGRHPDSGRSRRRSEGVRQRRDQLEMTAASAAARRLVKTSSSITGEPSGPVSGTRQFGYSSIVPGWFWARRSPTASVSARHSSRTASRSDSGAGPGRLLDLGMVLQGTPGPEIVQPGLAFGLVDGEFLLQRPGQDAEPVP